jgi:hypothetical protein
VDYFFEDYHFAVDLAVHADAISACIQIHDVKQARRLQTLSLKIDGTNIVVAREKVLLRMREWIRRRSPPRSTPTTVEDLQAIVQRKAELEEDLYQALIDAQSEDYRIECFYRIQRTVEAQTLLVAQALHLLPHRERDRFWALDPSLMAELMRYDIQSSSDVEPTPYQPALAAPRHTIPLAMQHE